MGDEVDAAFDAGFETAHDVYETITFYNPNAIYNRMAPSVTFTLTLGATLLAVLVVMWYVRYQNKMNAISLEQRTYWMSVRAMISAAIDNDSPIYTMVKICAQSIIFLAGIQIDYHLAFIVMIVFFTVESSLDSFRTLLCVYEYKDHHELVLTSERMRLDVDTTADVTKLNPTNVYEDMSRDGYVVVMVFITQLLLITFVVSSSGLFWVEVDVCGCSVGMTHRTDNKQTKTGC